MDDRSRYRQFEEQFLRQLRERATTLIRGGVPADRVSIEPVPDGAESVRATLARLQRFDRALLEDLPGGMAAQFRFSRRLFGPIRSEVARLRAQVLVPIEPLLNGQAAGPASRDQVLDALARYELLPRGLRPTGVVLASPTGFSADARALVDAWTGCSLILMTGRDDGGWEPHVPERLKKSPWARLFELETQDGQLRRMLSHLERNPHVLDSRGFTMVELSELLGVSQEQAQRLVRRACAADSRLMTVVHDGRTHLTRSPLHEEGRTVSLWSRVRRMLGMKPTVAERVRELTGQRVQLEQQRLEVDRKVDLLAKEESDALERARRATNDADRAQIVGTLKRVRSNLIEGRAMAQAFSNKIDIIGTQVHNLRISTVGERAGLPTKEELARGAAQAERAMTELSADADFARSAKATAGSPLSSVEDDAIWEEVRALGAEAEKSASQRSAAPAPDGRSSEPAPASRVGAAAPPPLPGEKSRARPELG